MKRSAYLTVLKQLLKSSSIVFKETVYVCFYVTLQVNVTQSP